MDSKSPAANSARQIELDAVKFLAIVFMAIVHCIEIFENDITHGAGYVLNNITGGIFAAPVFMLCMGVGFAYSRSTSPKYLIRRGLKILCMGYALNIIRSVVPLLYFVFTENGEMVRTYLAYFIEGDILQFAGLAMLLTGVLQYTKRPPLYSAMIGIALSLIHTFIPVLSFETLFPCTSIGLFVYSETPLLEMCFPFFGWYIFVGVGYLFGSKLRQMTDPSAFYLKFGIPFFAAAAAYTVVAYLNGYGMMACGDANFYKMSVTDAAACIGIAFGYAGFMRLVTHTFPKKIKSFIVKVSSRVNDIYIIHWIILEWVADAFLAWYLELTPGLFAVSLIGILVLAAAVPLSFVKNNVKNRLASKKTADR